MDDDNLIGAIRVHPRLIMIAAPILLTFAAPLWGQGTTPKVKAEEYPVHGAAGAVTLGADYTVHSLSLAGDLFIAPDYLVVEVALYGKADEKFEVNAGRFTLRVNGKKSVLLPQSPGMVAASIKYADWEMRRGVEMSAGVGDADVVLGRPRPTERFPGDPRPGQERLPQPPQAPEQENRSGMEKQAKVKPEDAVVAAALPEGTVRGPVSGYLYFAYKGKAGKIKSLELLYDGAVLKLI